MFQFAAPWLLLLIFLPGLVRWLIKPATVTGTSALKIPFLHRLLPLTETSQATLLFKNQLWLYSIWLAVILAAAGPQYLGPLTALPREGRNIMLALDISESMRIPDMRLNRQAVNRLTMVKAIARQFIQARQGDRLGLILFGTKAYLQTPLTFDTKTIENMLEDASIGLAGEQTALGDAMGLAIKRFQNTPKNGRVLILLTDGANNAGILDPRYAAKLAQTENIKIYTIGIGAEQLVVPTFLGDQVINPASDLDEKTLQEIAKISGGLFFRATNATELQEVYRRIHELEASSQEQIKLRPIKEFYFYPLALALTLSVLLAMRKIR